MKRNWDEDDLKQALKNNPSLAKRNEGKVTPVYRTETPAEPKESPLRVYSVQEVRTMSEDSIQGAFFTYLRANYDWQPLFELMYAIPNGSYKSKAQAVLFKRTGLMAGVPDTHLPVAVGGYHSLYIEFKTWDGELSLEQRVRFELLKKAGNKVVIARSVRAGVNHLKDYLHIPYEDD